MTSCTVGKKIGAVWSGHLELFPFVVLAICVSKHLFCVKDFSRTTVPRILKFCTSMTSMTSCIVGKKIGAMGPGPLELFPFVVLAICV